MRLGLLHRAKHDGAAGEIVETLCGVAGADEEHAALCCATVAIGEVGERRDGQFQSLGVEAHHRVLADDEVRLGADATQREVEAFLVNKSEAAAGRLLEISGELVGSASGSITTICTVGSAAWPSASATKNPVSRIIFFSRQARG